MSPTTLIPLRCNANTLTTSAAASIAISGPGIRGASHPNTSNTTRTDTANTTVGQCTPPNPAMNDPTWSRNSSPSTSTPLTLPSWLAIMMAATPAM
jgi:hypothetical protein